ncbi:hypothetical protein D3C84_896920 [compost metagenome]
MATRCPSVEYAGESGRVTPVNGYRLPRLAPESRSRRSRAPRLRGSVRVPASAIRVSVICMSACNGNGRLASCSASRPPILPLPESGWPL